MKAAIHDSEPSACVYWKKHIDACQTGGSSKSKYCRENDISYSQMMYWQKKLNQNDLSAKKPDVFVPVKIRNEAITSNDQGILCSLALPGGHVLRIHDEKAFSLLLEKWR